MFSGREDRNAEKLLFWEERNDRWNERELFCGSLICRLRRLCGFCVQILSESDSSEVGVPHDDVCYEYSRCGADWMIAQAALVFISMPPNFLLFMKTGVCGGFTTFSTFFFGVGYTD